VSDADAESPHLRGPRAAFHVIGQRDFGPYFVGNALSASGTWFQNLAASLLVYRLTGSEFLLGVLNFCQFLPVLLLAPWAGGVADRFDRRRLLLVTQSVAVLLSATLAALALADLVGAPLVIVFALLLGVVSAFSAPAQQALVTQLVPERDLLAAVALNSMTFNIARAAGPVLAAAAVALFGIPWAFLINAGSFAIFVGALLIIRPRPQRRVARAPFRESLRLVRDEPRLLWLLAVVMVVGFASDPINTLSPAFAHEFGYPDTVSGVIVGVFGAGAVTAALFFAGRTGSRRMTVLTLFLLSGGVALFSLSPSLWIGLGFLFVGGFGYLASNARATTQLQLGVDDAQRGRVMALWSVAFLGLRPFASLLDGAIAAGAGVRVAGVVLALPAMTMAFLIRRRIRTGAVGEPVLQES
jgi:MFS family permease